MFVFDHTTKWLSVFLVSIYSSVVFAADKIDIPMDLSSWLYQPEASACNLMHAEVPYGKFYFRSVTNHQITFEFSAKDKHKAWTSATLSLVTPAWVQPEKVTAVSQGKARSTTRFLYYSF